VLLCDLCGESFIPLESSAIAHRMPRKKKLKKFSAVTAVKELARERVGAPPPEKIVIEKKKKPEKHKPTLSKLLGETE
jgi:hypothetical protein